MAYRFALVSAIAAVSAFPEIIPGLGLPSVAELGLTSADLFTMDPIFDTLDNNKLAGRYDPDCNGAGTAIGREICPEFASSGKLLCTAGDAQVYATNTQKAVALVLAPPIAASACWDVALAVQWIFTNCNVNGLVQGTQAANGNGNLRVVVCNVNYPPIGYD